MVYSASDFLDDVIDALGITLEPKTWEDSKALSVAAVAEIRRLRKIAELEPVMLESLGALTDWCRTHTGPDSPDDLRTKLIVARAIIQFAKKRSADS